MDQAAATRRERFGYRKEGTGRETSPKRFNLGMRTGWMMPTDLPKDADGYDDIDALLQMGLPAKKAAAAVTSARASSNGVWAEGMHSMSPMGASFEEGDSAEYMITTGAGVVPAASHVAPNTEPRQFPLRGAVASAEPLDDDVGDVGNYGGDDRDDYDGRDEYEPLGAGAGGDTNDDDAGRRAKKQPAARKRPPAAKPSAMAKAGAKSKKQVSYLDDQASDDDGDGDNGDRRRDKERKRSRRDDDDEEGGSGSDSDGGRRRRRGEEEEEDEDAGFKRNPKKGPASGKAAGSSSGKRGPGRPRKDAGDNSSGARRGPKKRSGDSDRDRRQTRDDDEDDEDGSGDDEGRAYSRGRPSLHTGVLPGKRRRWAPLNHWAGERLKYTEDGPTQAEKIGVPSPVANRQGKRKRSESPRRGDKKGSKKLKKQRQRDRGRDERDSDASGSDSDSDGGGRGRSRSHSRASSDRGGDRGRDKQARGRSVSRSRSQQPQQQQQPAKRGPGRPPKAVNLRKQHDDDDDDDDGGVGGAGAASSAPSVSVQGTRLQSPLNPRLLPRNFATAKSPTLTVPAMDGHPAYQIAIVRDAANLAFEPLPAAEERGEGLDALAAAAFDAPEFISGTVRMRPLAVKDEESTHNCTQVFVVTTCQPQGLEVKIAGQRYLLSPGDHFFVPQATMYSMVNHSPSTPAEVAFVVIKAASMVSAAYEGGGGGDAAAAAAGGGSPIPPQPRLNSPSAYEGGGEGARAPRGSANRGREVAGDDGS